MIVKGFFTSYTNRPCYTVTLCRCRVPDLGRSRRIWAESARYCTKDAMYNVFESVGEASLEDRTVREKG